MTIEAINAFANSLRDDKEMASGLATTVGRKQGVDAAEAFAAFARERGHDVTREDVDALLAAAQAGEGTLSDEQLDGVSGGVSLGNVLGIVGPGYVMGLANVAGAAVGMVDLKKAWGG